MKYLIPILAVLSLQGCIAAGAPRCRRAYGISAPFVFVGVTTPCR